MGRSKISKRVTWPSDVNLCQIRLFSSEECPSQVGTRTRDHLQAKALKSGCMPASVHDAPPPGFEGMQRVKLSQTPLMKWKCPPRFEVNSDWSVASGEESRETEAQNQRQMRVLEAIYPRPSMIPPNPYALLGSEEGSTYDDQNTPLIPLTPIEDEDNALDTSVNNNVLIMPQPQHSSNGTFSSQSSSTTINPRAMGPDVVAAAQAALASIMPNNNQRSLIDTQLLIKFLTNPKIVEELVLNNGSSQNVPSSTIHTIPNISSNIPPNMPHIPSLSTPNTPSTSIMHSMPISTRTQYIPNVMPPASRPIPNGHFYPPSNLGGKDINYLKSLIQQHGKERSEILPQFVHQSCQVPLNMLKRRESKPKIVKSCIYFNTPKGCKNGVNCPYKHDMPSQKRANGVQEVRSAKRVKLDREITCS